MRGIRKKGEDVLGCWDLIPEAGVCWECVPPFRAHFFFTFACKHVDMCLGACVCMCMSVHVHVHVQTGGEHGVSFLRCHSLGFCDTESLLGLVLAK